MSSTNQVVIVTGASRGLGYAIAQDLVRSGLSVVNVDKETLDNVETHLFQSYLCDLLQFDFFSKNLISLVEEEFKVKVVGLVNNAIAPHKQNGLFEDLDSVKNLIDIGLITPYMLIQNFAEVLLSRKEDSRIFSVVNISSCVVDAPSDNAGSYHMAKGGLNALTKYASIKYSHLGIRVNSILPAFILKENDLEFYLSDQNRDYREVVERLHPIGRVGRERDVANMVSFLFSEHASFITGQLINIDGGYGLADPIKTVLDLKLK